MHGLNRLILLPSFLVFALLKRPSWPWIGALGRPLGMDGAWVVASSLGVLLALWLGYQGILIGFSAPVQWFTASLDLAILVSAWVPSTRAFYALPRKDS
ncbi:MAG: hypothetical protein H6727_18785 [Myxococcales bacterium]|nr:hypothetical protein [Myxococcales bacterium]